MEQDKLPCGDDTPHTGFDQEVFERVWRRIMPEDQPESPVRPEPERGLACAPQPHDEHAMPPGAMTGEIMMADAIPSRAYDTRAVQSDACCENDVPCLGAASAVHGAQLQDFIDGELADWRTYQTLSKRAQGTGAKILSTIAADERRHAKRLSTAYFLISGVRYWPIERMTAAPVGTFMGALRQRFCAEQMGEGAYWAAAADTTDPCLRELYQELAGEENAHAWLLRGVLEQL